MKPTLNPFPIRIPQTQQAKITNDPSRCFKDLYLSQI